MNGPIGGEFGISIEDLQQFLLSSERPDYKKKHHIFLDTGRSAIYVALTNIIQLGGNKEAWLPRYCCDSVILPFQQLGFKINFYSMGEDLKTPGNMPSDLKGKTFLFIHYFGKKNSVIIDWLNEVSKGNQSFFIIEDCVQATLNENVGHFGQYAIYSYRKLLAQPDGAVLAFDTPFDCRLAEPNEKFISEKLAGKIIRQYGGEAKIFLDLFAEAEVIIDDVICPRMMSWLSRFLFERTDLVSVASIRRRNWVYLTELLRSSGLADKNISMLYDSLEDGEVPLGLPVKIEDRYRDDFRNFLKQHNIYCPIHWPIQYEDNRSIWDKDIKLSKEILTLPIDQRLNQEALSFMVDKLKLFWED